MRSVAQSSSAEAALAAIWAEWQVTPELLIRALHRNRALVRKGV